MSRPYLSVVIPALDEEEEIEACLQSLHEQRFRDFEVIVVDNGSCDDTAARARAYGCRVVHEPRRGVSYARQAGFERACGRVIASTDADTVVPPDWIGRIARSFEEDPDQVGVYGVVRLRNRQAVRTARLAEGAFALFLKLNHRLGRPHFCGPNFAVRRTAFERVGGFHYRYRYRAPPGSLSLSDSSCYRTAEDLQLALKLARHGRVRFLEDLVVYTSPRKLRNARYLWSNAKTYWAVAWRGEER